MIWIAGKPPSVARPSVYRLVASVSGLIKIVYQMYNDVGRAALFREAEVLAVEHVTVKSESEVHNFSSF
jgi:hypothetical protein